MITGYMSLGFQGAIKWKILIGVYQSNNSIESPQT